MKKLFTFFAAAFLAMTVNASTVEWDQKFLDEDIWIYMEDGVLQECENNTKDGITATASTSVNGNVVFWAIMVFENGGGTLTFTSSVGNITKIEIIAPFGKFTKVENIEEADWSDLDKYDAYGNGVITWEGTPATSVTLSSVDTYIEDISSIIFTIEDAVIGKTIDIDFRSAVLGESNEKYLIINSDDAEYFVDDKPAAYNAYFTADSYNGPQHGYVNLKADIPLEAGNYKLTLGACGYGNGAGNVKNEDKTQTLASFNQQIEPNTKCYHLNPAENVVTATFTVDADQTIHVTCGNYTPYFKIEKLVATVHTITFDKGESDAKGVAPKAIEVVDGESFKAPANKTLYYYDDWYEEAYTLTGWNDGTTTHAIGETITPESDMTLTAVYTKNTVDIASTKNEVVVRWELGESNGAPSMTVQNGKGYLVTQAIVDGVSIDVCLQIEATYSESKFNNAGRNDQWAQVNADTWFKLPFKKDMVLEIKSYNELNISTLDSNKAYETSGSTGNYIAEFTTTSPMYSMYNLSAFSTGEDTYFSYFQVTYPKVGGGETAIDQVENGKAESTKLIRDGQVLINRNGILYTLTGQEVK